MKCWTLISAAIFIIPVFQSLPLAERSLREHKNDTGKIESFLGAIIRQNNDKHVSKMHRISVRAAVISNNDTFSGIIKSDKSKKNTENRSENEELDATKITENPPKNHQKPGPENISKSTENAKNFGIGSKNEPISVADVSFEKENYTLHSPQQKALDAKSFLGAIRIIDRRVKGNSEQNNNTLHPENNSKNGTVNQNGNLTAVENLKNSLKTEYQQQTENSVVKETTEYTVGNLKRNKEINLSNIVSTTTSSNSASQNETSADKLGESKGNSKYHQNDEISAENIKMISINTIIADTDAMIKVLNRLFRSKESGKNEELSAEKDEVSKSNSDSHEQIIETNSSENEVEQPEKKRDDINASNIAEDSLKGTSADLHSSNVAHLPQMDKKQNAAMASLKADLQQPEKKHQERNVSSLIEGNLTSTSLKYRNITLSAQVPHINIIEAIAPNSSKIETEQNNVKETVNGVLCKPFSVPCIEIKNKPKAPSETINK